MAVNRKNKMSMASLKSTDTMQEEGKKVLRNAPRKSKISPILNGENF
jgi:hypothetical protein